MWVLGDATVKAHTLQTLAPEFSPSGLCRKLCKRLPVQPQVIGEASSCFLCVSVCTNAPLSGRDHVHYGYFWTHAPEVVRSLCYVDCSGSLAITKKKKHP